MFINASGCNNEQPCSNFKYQLCKNESGCKGRQRRLGFVTSYQNFSCKRDTLSHFKHNNIKASLTVSNVTLIKTAKDC